MKGNISFFFGSYNSAGSKDVGVVDSVNTIDIGETHEQVPTKGEPNSVTISIRDGKTTSERYYDGNGDAYLDIDYTNHGNPKQHPKVPHQHRWIKDKNGRLVRGDWEDINK